MIASLDVQQTKNSDTKDAAFKSQLHTSAAVESGILGLSTNWFVVLVSICVSMIVLMLVVYTYKYYKKQQKKECELLSLTPHTLSTRPRITGVRPNETIEFVVPTITMSGSTPFSLTEDSMSDSDYFGFTSGSDREGRRRHPAGRYQISASEISRVLYPEYETMACKLDAKINFVLHYSFHRQQLLVTLLSAKSLPLNEKKSKINPFAKVILLPDRTPKFLTKVQKNNANPIFNELFIFPAKRATLDNRVLKISIWDNDRFSRKCFVARTFYPLSNAEITSLVTSDVITDEIWAVLSERKDIAKTGEILLSLCYKPETSTLTLGVIKVKNLSAKESNSVYVKVVLYVRKKKIRTRKTQSRKCQHEIEFNDYFHVHVDYNSLKEVIIAVTVSGRSTSSLSKHTFGKTFVGETCSVNQGVQHWFDMMQATNSSVVQSHHLSS
ncbi:Synaptotagmin-9-like protein [Leptotrombidium deliense]|uniref:Synaptotagmin-9-like protein n=1 Tax=Leptotrombidium deliense TaxID=299467 RepID=A0A443SQ93_9ACAR|nr:Synaptotagmin-9-like protein [Leptotrombidium deliense]